MGFPIIIGIVHDSTHRVSRNARNSSVVVEIVAEHTFAFLEIVAHISYCFYLQR